MTGYDAAPRRAVAAEALGVLDIDRRDLGRALGQWAARDGRPADADVRETASAALGVLDGMVAGLRELRARLAAEARASGDPGRSPAS